jgi:hypothetical protein
VVCVGQLEWLLWVRWGGVIIFWGVKSWGLIWHYIDCSMLGKKGFGKRVWGEEEDRALKRLY